MDAVTHTSILPSPDLFMPVRVGQLIIDPEEQATQIRNLHDISKGKCNCEIHIWKLFDNYFNS